MLAILAAAAASAAASAAPADPSGVWEGTVGNLPVRACFVRRDWGAFGAYYYLSQRRLIPLETGDGGETVYYEGSAATTDGPSWRIEQAGADRLTARWTGNGRTLPVRLDRVDWSGDADLGPCASPDFHRPRLSEVRTVTGRGAVDGMAFTTLALDHGGRFEATAETFALDGTGVAAQRINETLGKVLRSDPPEWLECVVAPLATAPREGDFFERLAPVLISPRWMSVTDQYEGDCGGAHPSGGTVWRTFDLASGEEVDLHDWLTDAAVKRERYADDSDEIVRTLQPAFRDVILAGWSAGDAECDETVRDADFWNIGLTREAFVFNPSLPHALQACGDVYTVPFARLRPFLTEQGAENLRALSAEVAIRR